ncbi:MAG: hypothetical protein LBO66_14740 [Deltaproteobacteria bacterium]|jgi:hypothetical protein|nr:hypothetical protein [Deltaproteobacteria bacterium]
MAFLFEAGRFPYRYVYLGEAFRDLEGHPRNRRIRVGKVDPVLGVKLFCREFLELDEMGGIKIPESIQQKAIEEMDILSDKYPERVLNFRVQGRDRQSDERRLKTPLFSIRDIQESSFRDFAPNYLLLRQADRTGFLRLLESNFNHSWPDLYVIGAFLATTDMPLSGARKWREGVDIFPADLRPAGLRKLALGFPAERVRDFFNGYHERLEGSQRMKIYSWELKFNPDPLDGTVSDSHAHVACLVESSDKGTPLRLETFATARGQRFPKHLRPRSGDILLIAAPPKRAKDLPELVESFHGVDFLCAIDLASPLVHEEVASLRAEAAREFSQSPPEAWERLFPLIRELHVEGGEPIFLVLEPKTPISPLGGQGVGLKPKTSVKEEAAPDLFELLSSEDLSKWTASLVTRREFAFSARALVYKRAWVASEYARIHDLLLRSEDLFAGISHRDFMEFANLLIFVSISLLSGLTLPNFPESYEVENFPRWCLRELEGVLKVRLRRHSILQPFQGRQRLLFNAFGVSDEELGELERTVEKDS